MNIDFSSPQVMAILNVTPDSFYAGSRTPEAESVERRVREAVSEGAQLLDVGGYSSRPGADEVPADEEWRRVRLGGGTVRRLAPGMTVSGDSSRSEVAAKAVDTFGPLVVIDISAGVLYPAMLSVVADCGVPYIAMHMKGDPKTMQSQTDYRRDIVTEVVGYFRRRTDEMLAAGIRRENIILDPGFGFAKTTEQNYELLAGLHRLCREGTNELLLEMPFYAWPASVRDTLYALLDLQDIQIVLAHAERYPAADIGQLARDGVPLQFNAACLTKPLRRKRCLTWIENGCVRYLGSDIHMLGSGYQDWEKCARLLEKRMP